jgi:hypothetical protein
MIEFAGIPLLDQTPELQAMLDGIWTPDWDHYRRPLNITNKVFHLPTVAQQSLQPPKLGVLRWPSDLTRWATMYVMASDQQLRDIIRTVGSGYGYGGVLKLSDGTNSINVQDMQILPPRPISQTMRKWEDPYPSQTTPDLWLLPLVDFRYFNQMSAGKNYYANTWSDLIGGQLTHFLSTYATTYTIDAIPSQYGTPDKDWWLGNLSNTLVPGTQYTQAAIEHTGGMFSKTIDGNFRVWRALNAKDAQKAAWNANYNNVIAGGLLNNLDIANACPKFVSTNFDDYPISSGLSARTGYDTYMNALSIAESGTVTGTDANLAVHNDAPLAGYIGVADAVTAVQVAKDYYNWRFASRVDAIFRGIVNWPISGADYCVEWSTGCYGRQPTTRVYPLPMHDWNRFGAPQVKRILRSAITGSKGGNVALGNLLTFLKNNGIIDDSTT